MSTAKSVSIAAQRRMILRLVVDRLGTALAIAAIVGVGAALVGKLTDLRVPLWMGLGAPTILGAAIAATLAWRSRPSLLDAAVHVDTALRLRDQVSTALVTAGSPDPFAAMAVDQGERIAAGIRVERSLPIRWGRAWVLGPLVMAVAIGVHVYSPDLSPRRRAAAEASHRTATQAFQVGQNVESALKMARQIAGETAEAGAISEATSSQLRALEDTRRELEAGSDGRDLKSTPDQSISRAAEALEQLAQSQQRIAEESRRQSEAAAEDLAAVPPQPAETGSMSSPLREALRSGDLEAARRAASDLMRRTGEGGAGAADSDRAKVAEELSRLADDLRQLAEAREKRASASATQGKAASDQPGEPTEAGTAADPLGQPESGVQPPAADRGGATPAPASRPDDSASQTRELSERVREAAKALGQPRQDSASQPEGAEGSASGERGEPQSQPEGAKPEPVSESTTDSGSSRKESSGPTEDQKNGPSKSAKEPQPKNREPSGQNPSSPAADRPSPDEAAHGKPKGSNSGQAGGKPDDPTKNPAKTDRGPDARSNAAAKPTDPAADKQPSEGGAKGQTDQHGNKDGKAGDAGRTSDAAKTPQASPHEATGNKQAASDPARSRPNAPGAERSGERGATGEPNKSGDDKSGTPDDADRPAPAPNTSPTSPNAKSDLNAPVPPPLPGNPTKEPLAKPGEQGTGKTRPDGDVAKPAGAAPDQKPVPNKPGSSSADAESPQGGKSEPSASEKPLSVNEKAGADTEHSGTSPSGTNAKPASSGQPKPNPDPSGSQSPRPTPAGKPDPNQHQAEHSTDKTEPNQPREPSRAPTLEPTDRKASDHSPSNPDGSTKPPEGSPKQPSEAQRRAFEQLGKQLGRMAGAKDQARKHEQNAEQLLKQAQKLYDSASPEQRERMNQWARQMGRNGPADGTQEPGANGAGTESARREGGPGQSPFGSPRERPAAGSLASGSERKNEIRTEPIDARSSSSEHADDSGREQVVAEWLGQGSDQRVGESAATVQERLRAAARSAEQAIGDRAVPSRYDRILRDYFDRLPRKFAPASSAATTPTLAPAATPAVDERPPSPAAAPPPSTKP